MCLGNPEADARPLPSERAERAEQRDVEPQFLTGSDRLLLNADRDKGGEEQQPGQRERSAEHEGCRRSRCRSRLFWTLSSSRRKVAPAV